MGKVGKHSRSGSGRENRDREKERDKKAGEDWRGKVTVSEGDIGERKNRLKGRGEVMTGGEWQEDKRR